MTILLVLPIIIPLVTAIAALLLHRRGRAQRVLAVSGAVALLAAGVALLRWVWVEGIQVVQFGGWVAPYGITFVADLFSAIMVVLAGILGLAVILYSLSTIDLRRELFGYYALFHILLMGVCGAFLTGDLFNLYVWFEVLLIASFVLMALGGERGQLEGGIKYVTLNLISSSFFLAAVGLLYAEAGTLNMADLAQRLPELPQQGLLTTLSMLLLVAFGIKAALFPLFFWLPASYHTPPFAVSAIFAGLLTKVGVYALVRTFTLIFTQDTGYTHSLILIATGLTMVSGVLGALSQSHMRRIFSFLIVSHIGFALMGLGLYTSSGLAGLVFYVIEDMLVLTTLFLVGGLIRMRGGSEEMAELGGLYRSAPGLALLFMIPALSLAGIPPFSGFLAKLALLRAALEIGQYGIVATGLTVSLLTLLTLARLWSQLFWKPMSGEPPPAVAPHGFAYHAFLWAPPILLAGLIVMLSILAGPMFELAARTAEQLYDPALYIRLVLGGAP